MNHFDKPIVTIAAIAQVLTAIVLVIMVVTNTPGPAFATACLLLFVLAITFVVGSEYAYRKPHAHTSVVKSLWTERHVGGDIPGKSFAELTTNYHEAAYLRLTSGGTYILGPIDAVQEQSPQVRIGDMVTVRRQWSMNKWSAEVLGVVPANRLRFADKPKVAKPATGTNS